MPKGLLELAGRRLIDRVLDALDEVSDELLLIANDPAAGGWAPGIPLRADVRAEGGALAGLHSALTHASDAAMVVAWDMPFVNAGLLRALRELGETRRGAALPESARGLEPLCAYYPAPLRSVAESLLARGERRVGAFVEALRASNSLHVLPAGAVARYGDPARLFLNVNTPADLAEARRLADQPGSW